MAANWAPVYANALDSMFFVMLTPSEEGVDELDDIAMRAGTVPEAEERDELVRATKVSTGFAVGIVAGDTGVLTTAHSIEHLFRASRPISRLKINELFTIRVLCKHYETAFRQAGNLDAEREYAIGRVAWIDCAHDLMLVAVPMNQVTRFGGGGVPCPGPHPALRACRGLVDLPTNECLMVSWQEYKPGMMSVGRLGATRTVNEIRRPNLCEYHINLLEVQVCSGPGSSGSPLMNRNGELIGVMHAIHVHDRSHAYFVDLGQVRSFLDRFVPPPPVVAPLPVV